jgi:ribosome assembly protein YihI (activator of Der GTPase)
MNLRMSRPLSCQILQITPSKTVRIAESRSRYECRAEARFRKGRKRRGNETARKARRNAEETAQKQHPRNGALHCAMNRRGGERLVEED